MISFKDIYYRVDSNLIRQNFWQLEIEEKRKLIDKELKNYTFSKLKELNIIIPKENEEDLSISDLLVILGAVIPNKQHKETLCHFIHYIILVSGNLQNWSIIWYIEDDESLIKTPIIEFDDNNKWTTLKTNKNTNYTNTFNFVYEVFNNKFLTKKRNKCLRLNYINKKES